MAIFTTPFGTNTLVANGGNVVETVHNRFGPRDIGGTVGVLKVEGMDEELVIDFTGEEFNDLPDGLMPFVLPAGAVLKEVYVDVEEPFVATGTTPALNVGTDGSEATNGFTISEAILEGTGSANVTSTLKGTWAVGTPLQANTQIGFALGGTTPVVTDAGKARITIKFYRINRAPSPARPGGPALP